MGAILDEHIASAMQWIAGAGNGMQAPCIRPGQVVYAKVSQEVVGYRMVQKLTTVREWRNVDPDRFQDKIRAIGQPAVMRGLVKDWPLVRRAAEAPENAASYLAQLYRPEPVGTINLPPGEGGRFFYNQGMNGYNFRRTEEDLRAVLTYLLKSKEEPQPAAVAVQAIPAREILPGFENEHPMPLAPQVAPNLWISNQATVAPHYDIWENIACAAAGRRRFTLFPPEQLPNLYVGPLDNTPAGAPVSMVDIANPDLDRFPRFQEALDHAQTAELEPGDAIYIPYMWWHGVQALDRFNVLVNYWWNEHFVPGHVHPMHALMVAHVALRTMSEPQRKRWRAMFDRYVFCPPVDLMDHLPLHARGVLGDLDQSQLRRMRQMLAGLVAPD